MFPLTVAHSAASWIAQPCVESTVFVVHTLLDSCVHEMDDKCARSFLSFVCGSGTKAHSVTCLVEGVLVEVEEFVSVPG